MATKVQPGKPTITDVARRAGVSKSLVSLVMRGADHVSAARRQAVVKAASELGYRPNAMARSLVQRRTHMIGVMVSDLHNPFFADVVAGMQGEASRTGYKVLVNTGNRAARQEADAVETLLQLRADGIILAAPVLEDDVILRASREVPIVLVAREMQAASIDIVTNDDRAGAEVAVEHCASLGHRRIAHIDGGGGAGAAARRRGYEAAMSRLGLGGFVSVVAGTFTEEGGHRGALVLLARDPRPTAIIAANDLAAIGALNAIEEGGLRVPDDVSLVGYDNTSLASLRHISLTTIHQPRLEMGRLALATLLERVDDGRVQPRRVVLSPSLVVRASTGRPRLDGARGL
ncbi:MAG TPA: LacI family DNA-binding transcriptional regulator [Vicinamibacteria bacterium]|nr:LacI family DNA-binding transcriptional regulator [Vicinamibacteria bacterium]